VNYLLVKITVPFSYSVFLMMHRLMPVCLANAPGDVEVNPIWCDRGRVIALTFVWNGSILVGYRCCCGYVPKRYRISEKIVTQVIEPCSSFWDVYDYAVAIAEGHRTKAGKFKQLVLFDQE
jgi:hypothetical protein